MASIIHSIEFNFTESKYDFFEANIFEIYYLKNWEMIALIYKVIIHRSGA